MQNIQEIIIRLCQQLEEPYNLNVTFGEFCTRSSRYVQARRVSCRLGKFVQAQWVLYKHGKFLHLLDFLQVRDGKWIYYKLINSVHTSIKLYNISRACAKPKYTCTGCSHLVQNSSNLYKSPSSCSKHKCTSTKLNSTYTKLS